MIYRSAFFPTPGVWMVQVATAIFGLFFLLVFIDTGQILFLILLIADISIFSSGFVFSNYIKRVYYSLDENRLKAFMIFPFRTHTIPIDEMDSYFDPFKMSFNIKKHSKHVQKTFDEYSHLTLGNPELVRLSISIIHNNKEFGKEKQMVLVTPLEREKFLSQLRELGIDEIDLFRKQNIKEKNRSLRRKVRFVKCSEDEGKLYKNTYVSTMVKFFMGMLIVMYVFMIGLSLEPHGYIPMLILLTTSIGMSLFVSFFLFIFLNAIPYWVKISDRRIYIWYKLGTYSNVNIHASEIHQFEFYKNNKVMIYCHNSVGLKSEFSINIRRAFREFAERNTIKTVDAKDEK